MPDAIQSTYRSAFKQTDLMSKDTVVQKGSYLKIGEYVVEAGEYVRLGYGNNNTQSDAQGRIFVDLKDNTAAAPVDVDGILRFSVHSPQGQPLQVLTSFRTEQLRTDISNRGLQIPFPNTPFPNVSKDKKIVLEFLVDDAQDGLTVSHTNTKMLFDITMSLLG